MTLSVEGPGLDEDTIDDILFFARTNDLPELRAALTAAASASDLSQRAILQRAIDAETGNTASHMAAANGHVGMKEHLWLYVADASRASGFPGQGTRRGHDRYTKCLWQHAPPLGGVEWAYWSGQDAARGWGEHGSEKRRRA